MQVFLIIFLCFLLFAVQAPAFDPPIDSAGPITASIQGPNELSSIEKPCPISVLLENKENDALQGEVEIGLIDGWKAEPQKVSFNLPAKSQTKLNFNIFPASQTYNAHYPIHAFVRFKYNGKDYQAHPILVLRTNIPNPPKPHISLPWKPFEVRRNSALALWRLPIFRIILRVFGKEPEVLPVGLVGSDTKTRAVWSLGERIARGDTREAIGMHPPWFNNLVGTIIMEFPLRLPKQKPIVLRFANAIRDNFPPEPPSDGVTFRVRVLPFSAPEGEEGEILFEKHTLTKVWDEGEVDLSRFAGQSIRLQLESHPGPKNDTTCDQSYWAEPTLIVGTPPQRSVFPPSLDAEYIKLGNVRVGNQDYEVRIWEGNRGILDSTIGFVNGSKNLLFNGFKARILGDDLSDWRSTSILKSVRKTKKEGHIIYSHSFSNWLGDFDLLTDIWIEKGALRVKFWLENVPPARPWLVTYIEDISLGEWSEKVDKVYAGDGNVLVEPKAFNLWFDGHQLSTSFVGFEFKNGLSIVEGVDAVPSYLEVSPQSKLYTLHTPHNQIVSIIPAETTWQGAKIWREINGLKPAGGVKKLAGRFVFDLWGGGYKKSAEALERAFRYGLTDSLVVWHNWQRWGYDYRLPDIYPPNPQFGTLDEFLQLVNTCKKHGVLFAPHDNYIDFYPDAQGFSYKRISFTREGNPVPAWFNEGRKAQSYRWRADQLFPFLERNLRLIKEGFSPTAYFIDVWSSICPYDYWTDDGSFFTRLYTRDVWRKAFAWIRDFLGDSAPQISESGHDQLIGWLDGGQTNHLRVDIPPPGYYGWAVWSIQCKDAERIPWFDMAHHSKFALHGAGYEGRYVAGLDPRLHGIYSDDYIATEVLTGHPAMVPSPFGRDVVRKYWLLHDLMRALALKDIEDVQFVEGDIHKQFVKWDNGGEVWVNRGKEDWQVEGHILPQYGVYARVPAADGTVEVAIEKKEGVIVDWSRSPSMLFVNARPVVSERLPVKVRVESLKFLGDRQAELTLLWEAKKPLPTDMMIFVHFVDKNGEIMFQADHTPPIPTTKWEGSIRSSTRFTLPDKFKAGDEFEMRVGMWDTKTGERARLEGYDDGTARIRLGEIKLEGTGGNITGIMWTPLEEKEDPVLARLNPQGRMIDFAGIRTNGAFRLSMDGDALLLTPLPNSPQFEARIKWNSLPWKVKRAEIVEEVDEEGKVLRSYPLRWEGEEAVLICGGDVFAYRLK
ncbi:MAG: hypothetical protein ACPLPS_04455 [bacterium]